MKILLLALFVATVSAGSVKVGTIKCTFGPSYWCQNYKQATECNAIQHCREKVWKLSSNETCTICEDAVTAVKSLLANPDIDKQIVGYLEMACQEFGAYASECKTLVDQYAPLLFQELAQLMADPKQVCTELGLCSASKEKVMAVLLNKALPIKMKAFKSGISLKKHAKNALKAMPVKASAKCILCEFIASKLDQMLAKNATQQEIKDALDKVCSYLPSSISSECEQFVNEYAPEILQILAQELNPNMICTSLGLCTSKAKMAQLRSSGEQCEICTLVLTYAKNLLNDNTTDEEIIDALKQVCGYLPSQIASECTAIVSEYGLEVLKLIANTDAKTLCTEIGLCSAKVQKLQQVVALKDKCFLGASFWCANKANAVKCNATAFCKKHAW